MLVPIMKPEASDDAIAATVWLLAFLWKYKENTWKLIS
jgi:hypothetical protein